MHQVATAIARETKARGIRDILTPRSEHRQ